MCGLCAGGAGIHVVMLEVLVFVLWYSIVSFGKRNQIIKAMPPVYHKVIKYKMFNHVIHTELCNYYISLHSIFYIQTCMT